MIEDTYQERKNLASDHLRSTFRGPCSAAVGDAYESQTSPLPPWGFIPYLLGLLLPLGDPTML